jgi:Myb-like DNA-binding domain
VQKLWTPEEDQRLLEMTAAGRKPVVIAKELKRTEAAVLTRLYKLQRHARDPPNEEAVK